MTVPDSNAINLRLDTVNLVQNANGSFSAVGPVPDWFADFGVSLDSTDQIMLQDHLLFFDTYLLEIQDGLERDPKAVLGSGPWSEADIHDEVRDLSALALLENNQLVIQIKLVATVQKYQQTIFQQARNYSLKFEKLIKDKEHKEILLHTIIHDLAGPLTSIHGVLELMARGRGTPELTAIARKQCQVQKDMIANILETFVSGTASYHLPTSESEAPDIVYAAHQALVRFQPAFDSKNVTLSLASHIDTGALKVFAEADLLDRVLSNLIENALRYSPPGSKTEIELTAQDNRVLVSIEDEGPGIPEKKLATIFDLYSGSEDGGQIGLGLYFCKIALERWGGKLRCEHRGDGPGCRFEFELVMFDRNLVSEH